MKKSLFNIALLFGVAASFQSCQNSFDDPGLVVPEATMQANTTLADFKKAYQATNAYNLTPEDNIIIRGRVVSSDATGNIYQSLVIQDATSALPITIRRASLYTDYHLGQEVVINTAGLWIGKYNGLIQLGWLGQPYNGEDQLTFMSFAEFSTHTQLNGLPAPTTSYILPSAPRPTENIYCLVENIDDLPTAGEDMYRLQGQLVEFRNASFDGGGELTYAPYQENANRYIQQEGGKLKLTVRNSGYSTFYNDVLPEGTGTVRGILSWYGDGSSSTTGVIGGWQLLLRSTEDVIIDTHGTREDPFTLAEVIEKQNQGISGWTEGYIVGSVKGGVSAATAADVIFSAEAEMDNNLVIAPTPDCTDFSQCVAVLLPQGSDFRKYGNLADNPAVYKKSIVLRGSFASVFGMPGVADNGGSAADFEIDGVEIGGGTVNPPSPTGSGTEADPYSVTAVLNGATGTSAWVQGYIVGFIAGKSIQDGAVFSNDVTGKDYTNTNVIIAASPDETDWQKCVPLQLPTTGTFRQDLGLGNNPAAYKREVKVCGSLEKYFGQAGVKSLTAYAWVDGGDTPVTPPDDPTPGVGDGSASNPFDVASVVSGTAKGKDVWVEGVVVGYVDGMTYSGATFGLPGENADYTNTNLLLGPSSDCKDASKCIPVQLPTGVREELGLKTNPSILLKKVKLKGNIEKYFGQEAAMKSVTEYVIE